MVHPIAAYRKVHGLTQPQFAERIGLLRDSKNSAHVTVARWESGARTPSLDAARQIARVTGIPLLKLRPDLADVAREVTG